MHECINVEMKIGCKPCIIVDLLWSPRKLQDELRNEKSGMKMTCTFFERNIIENATLKFDLQEVIRMQLTFEIILIMHWYYLYISGKPVNISCIQISTSKLFMQHLTCKFFTLLLVCVRCGIIKIQQKALQTFCHNVWLGKEAGFNRFRLIILNNFILHEITV